MITKEQINYFRTLGFLQCKQFLSQDEVKTLSDAFDKAMGKARDGASEPELQQDANGYSAVRQQVTVWKEPFIPFFDYNPDVFHPLLDDERFVEFFRHLFGDAYYVGVSEAIIHAGGTGWHHDHNENNPEETFSGRAHMYLDPLSPVDGCLNVIPGSHFREYRHALAETVAELGVRAEDMPGRYPLVNEPGDVIFLNHKTRHAALSSNRGRRCIHINVYNPAPTDAVPELVEGLTKQLHSEHYEIHHTSAAALKRIATPEALKAVEAYEKRLAN